MANIALEDVPPASELASTYNLRIPLTIDAWVERLIGLRKESKAEYFRRAIETQVAIDRGILPRIYAAPDKDAAA